MTWRRQTAGHGHASGPTAMAVPDLSGTWLRRRETTPCPCSDPSAWSAERTGEGRDRKRDQRQRSLCARMGVTRLPSDIRVARGAVPTAEAVGSRKIFSRPIVASCDRALASRLNIVTAVIRQQCGGLHVSAGTCHARRTQACRCSDNSCLRINVSCIRVCIASDHRHEPAARTDRHRFISAAT